MDPKTVNPKSPKSEIREYQRTLQRAGFYFDPIDGDWGPNTQRAHEALNALTAEPKGAGNRALISIRSTIIETAVGFLGLTERTQNSVWDDVMTAGPDARASELRAQLLATGWQLGWAYCAAFGEVCWRQGYRGYRELALISQAITPSVMGTYENFKDLGRVSKVPEVGALLLMQKGKTWQGHMEIVTKVSGNTVDTIGGNTSAKRGSVESQRNGDGVFRKSHVIDFTPTQGLHLIGFVNPFLV